MEPSSSKTALLGEYCSSAADHEAAMEGDDITKKYYGSRDDNIMVIEREEKEEEGEGEEDGGYTSPGDALLAAAERNRQETGKLPFLASMKTKRRTKKLRKFYDEQSAFVHAYKKDMQILKDDAEKLEGVLTPQEKIDRDRRRSDEILAQITFALNVVLLILKTVAAVSSGSLAVVSTVIDSAVDITSGMVIWLTVRAIEKRDPYEYPRGRERLEPVAVVIVSIVMGVANIVMIIQSLELILNNQVNPHVDWLTIGILIAGTSIKIVLFVLCNRQGTSSGKVLAMDQRNDVITNLVALAAALVGNHFWIYMDPLGAILVCSYIAGSWFYVCAGQIPILSGKVAGREFINRIIRVAISHDDRIRCLDTIFVYHYGTNFLVELHVVMDPEMSLRESHDVTAPLQDKLEKLPYVERAFVHCDYELDGFD